MSQSNIIRITSTHDGQRLDRWMKKIFPHVSFGQSQKLIRTGQIRINGKRAKADSILEEGTEVRLPPFLADGSISKHKAQQSRLSEKDAAFIRSLVVYEDKNLLALNKPHDLAVQGGTKTGRHIDGLLAAFQKKHDDFKPKLLHRIDKDTSGLLLCGKTNDYTKYIMQSFKSKRLQKAYLAICAPAPEMPDGTIKAPLLKAKIGGQERVVVDAENGQSAITEFQVLDQVGKDAALVLFMPVTGRTHQIRVHAAFMGCPVLGDPKYNKPQSIPQHLSEEDVTATIASLLDLCSYKGLHLHACAAHIPAQGSFPEQSLYAPPSKEIEKSAKRLGLTIPPKDEIMDFTKPENHL